MYTFLFTVVKVDAQKIWYLINNANEDHDLC